MSISIRLLFAAALPAISGLYAQSPVFQNEYMLSSGVVTGNSFRNTGNGYIVTGKSGNNPSELFLMETDAVGQVLWSGGYSFSGFPFTFGTSAISSPGGGFLAGGFGLIQNQSYYTLLQTSSTGTVNWSAIYEVDTLFFLTGSCGVVDTTADGGYIMASDVIDNATMETWTHVFRTDNFGNVTWSRMYNRYLAAKSHIADIERCPDGGYIFCGSSVDSTINLFLTRIDSAGNLLWTKHYTPPTNFGQAIAVGLAPGNGFIVHGTAYNGSVQEQPVLMQTDSAGNVLWAKIFGSSGNYYYGKDMTVAGDGYVMIFQAIVGGRGCMSKTDLNGNLLWTKHFGNKEMKEVAISPGGGCVALANSNPALSIWLISADTTGATGCDTAIVFTAVNMPLTVRSNLTSQNLVMTPVAHNATKSLQPMNAFPCVPNVGMEENNAALPGIYPNPASGSIHFTNIRPEFTVVVYSLQGQRVLEAKPASGENSIDVSALASGMYVVDLFSENGERVLRKKIIIAD